MAVTGNMPPASGVTFANPVITPAPPPPGSVPPNRWYAVVVGCTPQGTGVYKDYAMVAPLVVGVSSDVF
jgi:hypothetical protein